MEDFEVSNSRRPRSIGFDATKRGGVIVTVGIFLNRMQEAHLLDNLHQELYQHDYRAFRTKSRDLSLPSTRVQEVMMKCPGQVGICIHQDNVKLPYAEAAHSAILLDDLNVPTDEAVAIVDGGESHAAHLYHATSELDIVPPPIAHCTQAELYYPHLLLADLIAGAVADTVQENPGVPSSVATDESSILIHETTPHEGRWGQAFAGVARGEGGTPQPTFEQRFASSFRERLSCWYHGYFGDRNSDPPRSDGIRPVVGSLRAAGYIELADWIDSSE